MAEATHTFDPQGKVIIVLQCTGHPLAPYGGQKRKRGPGTKEVARKKKKTSKASNATDGISSSEGSSSSEFSGDSSDSSTDLSSEEDSYGEAPAAEEPTTKCYRIQVSAKHLTLASAVFERALKGGWKEGTSLLEKGSVEITVDSWDLEAFLILMNIFHARPQKVPKAVSLELLAKVTVLADYYECQESVEFFASKWFNLPDDEPLPKDHRDLMLSMWITWVFKQSSAFERLTAAVIRHSKHSVTNLGLPIPKWLIDELNSRREKAIATTLASLNEQRDAFLSGTRSGCCFRCSSMMFGVLSKRMLLNDILPPHPPAPFPGISYDKLMKTMGSAQSLEWCVSNPNSGQDKSHKCSAASISFPSAKQEATVKDLVLEDLQKSLRPDNPVALSTDENVE